MLYSRGYGLKKSTAYIQIISYNIFLSEFTLKSPEYGQEWSDISNKNLEGQYVWWLCHISHQFTISISRICAIHWKLYCFYPCVSPAFRIELNMQLSVCLCVCVCYIANVYSSIYTYTQ